jgi:CheY-like chemotaxis protein
VRSPQILVVEDVEEFRRFVCSLLQACGQRPHLQGIARMARELRDRALKFWGLGLGDLVRLEVGVDDACDRDFKA